METVNASPAASRKALYTALLFMVATNALWGMYFPLIKAMYLLIDFPSLDREGGSLASLSSTLAFVCIRFLGGLLLFAALFPKTIRSLTRRSIRAGMMLGTVFVIGIVFQLLGLRMIPASRSALITSLTVLTTPWVAAVWFRRWPSKRLLAACALSFVGAAILVEFVRLQNGSIEFDLSAAGLGDLVTFGGTICFSITICQIDSFNRAGIRGELTPGMFLASLLVGGLGALSLGTLFHPLYVSGPRAGAVPFPLEGFTEALMILGSGGALAIFTFVLILPTVFAFYWMNSYQGHFSPGHAALLYMLEPLSAALWSLCLPAWMSGMLSIDYPSERLTASLVIGGTFILVANLIPALEE